jgi:hypothetical protein
MLKKKILSIPLLLIILVVFGHILIINSLFISPAQATEFKDNLSKTANKAGYDISGSGKEVQFFATTVGKAIALFLTLLGALFLILMIYAGFRWMMAQGNEQEVISAKKIIKNASIGLIIVIAAFAITAYIGSIVDLAPEVEPVP